MKTTFPKVKLEKIAGFRPIYEHILGGHSIRGWHYIRNLLLASRGETLFGRRTLFGGGIIIRGGVFKQKTIIIFCIEMRVSIYDAFGIDDGGISDPLDKEKKTYLSKR